MLSFYGTEKKKCVLGAQRTVRNEEDKTLFSLGRSTDSSVVGLLPDQLAQPEGTVNAPLLTFTKSKFKNDRPRAVLRLDLGLQRLLHPSWVRESAGRMRGFVTLGCRQLYGSCHFARPQSESIFVFVCLCLRHCGVPSAVKELPVRSYPERVCLRRLPVRCSTSRA